MQIVSIPDLERDKRAYLAYLEMLIDCKTNDKPFPADFNFDKEYKSTVERLDIINSELLKIAETCS